MKPLEKELLLILYRSPKKYQTSKELAERLNLSERTVRTYLGRLKSLVNELGGRIEARQGNGYRLILEQPKQFESYLFKSRLEELARDADVIDSSSGRRDVIISRLLLNNETIEALELADSLYISESTLKKELNSLKDLLDVYGLKLVTIKKKLQISGEEADKRKMILDYFFRNKKFVSLREYMDHSGFFDDIPSESILMILLEELRNHQIRLSDMMIQNLLLHIALSIKRLQCGQELERFEYLESNFDPALVDVSTNVISRVSDLVHLEFPQAEIRYLTLHLTVKSNPQGSDHDQIKDRIKPEVKQALARLAKISKQPADQDEILENSIMEHMVPLTARLSSGIQQQNPLTAEIQEKYPDVLAQVRKAFSKMPCLAPYEITDDEWAYLVIHFLAAIDRVQESRKLQVLVICATGFGSSQLLKNRLMKKFSDSIHIANEAGYYDMNDQVLEGIDLIISSVNMGPVIFGVPFLHVSVFLSDDDVAKIQTFIDKKEARKAPKIRVRATKSENNQLLERQLPQSNFFVLNKRPSRDDVIDLLVSAIARNENEYFVKKFKDQLTLREKMGNVAFSEQIVVGHPAVPLAEHSSFALALVPEGVAWDENFQDIQFVFLMSPSYEESDESKMMVESIIDLIEQPELQKQILDRKDYRTFCKVFGSLLADKV